MVAGELEYTCAHGAQDWARDLQALLYLERDGKLYVVVSFVGLVWI